MIRRPPRSTRTDTLFPYPTLFRSREPCHLVGGQAQLQGHRAEAAAGLALLLEAFDVFWAERDDLRQPGDQRLRVAGVLGHHVESERRPVVGPDPADRKSVV